MARKFNIYDSMEFPTYEYKPYPRMLHMGKDHKVVRSEDEEKMAMAEGWSKDGKAPPPTVEPAMALISKEIGENALAKAKSK